MLPSPRVLSYDDLRELAEEFLWYEFQERFPEESRSWYEWQANSFGGLILVPPEALAEKLEEAKALAREGGMEVDLEDDRTRSYLGPESAPALPYTLIVVVPS